MLLKELFSRYHHARAAALVLLFTSLLSACVDEQANDPGDDGGDNSPPVIISFSVAPNPVDTGTEMGIGWVVSDPDGDALTCRIDADGDGNTDYTISNCANVSAQAHVFAAPGNYTTRLTVTDGNGGSAQQSVSVSAVGAAVGIDAPANPRAVAGDGQVTLSWDGVAGATAYNVYMATESGVRPDTYSVLAGGVAHLDVSSPFTVTGLNNGGTYYFVITAANGTVESPAGTEVSASPTAALDISALIADSQSESIIQAATTDFDLYQSAQLTVLAPEIAENGAVVPVTLQFDSFDPGPGALWLLVPGNQDVVAARFLIEPNVVPYAATRIKMTNSSDVVAVYLAANGSVIYTAKKYVQVTIGVE